MIDFQKELDKITVRIVLFGILSMLLIFGLLHLVIKEEITSRDDKIWQLEIENKDLKEQIYQLERCLINE